MGAACGTAAFRQLIDATAVDPAFVGEEENVVQRARKEEIDDLIFSMGLHALDAAPAPALGAEGGGRNALDVGAGAVGNQLVVLLDKVFFAEVAGHAVGDVRAPQVAEALLQPQNVFPDQPADFGRVGQEIDQIIDAGHDLGILIDDLLPFQSGQPAQLHVENGLGLDFREPEFFHERGARIVGRLAFADRLDHFVQVVQRDEQPFQNVGSLAGFAQLIFRAPGNDFEAVLDVDDDRAAQTQCYRLAPIQRQHIDAEGRLQGGGLEELILHLARRSAPLQLDDDAHAPPVALIAQIADLVQASAPG